MHSPGLVAARQGGVFSTEDARRCGLGERDVTAALRNGSWHQVRKGWYVERETWAAATAEQRHLLAAHAVLLPTGDRYVASHTTAATALGPAQYRRPAGLVHITSTDGTAGRTGWGVARHEGLLDLADCPRIGPIRVAPAPVAVAGAMVVSDRPGALVVGDSALHRRLVTHDQLRAVAHSWRQRTGNRLLREHIELLHEECASPGETLTLDLIRLSPDVPEPTLQHRVELPDGSVAFSDFAWEAQRLLGEFDGRSKYERHRRPGESSGDVVFREKRREDLLRACGWRVVRFTWADLYAPQQMLDRIVRALWPSGAPH